MAKTNITAHMIIKNDDRFVWYAIQSVLPYVDEFAITDTGSSDNTIAIIKTIKSEKIELICKNLQTPEQITTERNLQIKKTKTKWLWVVDGDEIYPHALCKEILIATAKKYSGIAVRRYDLLGDIYHRQIESVGEYRMLGQKGHLVTRLINLDSFPGLHVGRPYPQEAYLDQAEKVIHSYGSKNWYITQGHLYHAMYLRRSSKLDKQQTLNRNKHKIELGQKIFDPYPEIFDEPRPPIVPDVRRPRALSYTALATLITPIKKIKRKIL